MRHLILILALTSTNAFAELSMAYGVDVIHSYDPDIDETWEYGEIRYSHMLGTANVFSKPREYGWHGYVGSNDTVGIGLYGKFDDWKFGWGVEFAEPNELTSTEGGYELLVEYALTEHWALSLKHRSNCRDVCTKVPFMDILPHGDEDTSNRGANYLTVRYTFREEK